MSNGTNAIVGLIPVVVAAKVVSEVDKQMISKKRSRKQQPQLGLFSAAKRL